MVSFRLINHAQISVQHKSAWTIRHYWYSDQENAWFIPSWWTKQSLNPYSRSRCILMYSYLPWIVCNKNKKVCTVTHWISNWFLKEQSCKQTFNLHWETKNWQYAGRFKEAYEWMTNFHKCLCPVAKIWAMKYQYNIFLKICKSSFYFNFNWKTPVFWKIFWQICAWSYCMKTLSVSEFISTFNSL